MSLFMDSGFIVVVFLLSHVRLFCDPMDCGLHRVLCPWDFPGKSTEWVSISFSRGSSWPDIEPVSPTLTGNFFFFLNHWATREALDSGKTNHLFGPFHKLVIGLLIQLLSVQWSFSLCSTLFPIALTPPPPSQG